MLSIFHLAFLALALLSASEPILGREVWLERNNRAIQLNPRRFGQNHPAVLTKLRAACGGGQGECTQQDMADQIIDASKQFDAATQKNMLAIAIEYRQTEKNTPPDFKTKPPTLRNSVFCQKAPKNAELNGLVQAQDPANDPNVFFDPATQKSVKLGAQANTRPFDGKAASNATTSA
ncbi:hypothetical protein MVEN_01211500 [Mycena venus]|uniref:Uncharacterized protein n=1 Tax=Mycena venus TaxID=2733690 RepID=A0A8H7CYD0_9AGAR|nr:hypothetical protein MVEN_01211500 [Mycena venus]